MRCFDSWCLKLVREISVSSFRDFCSSFQSLAAEKWKERRPKEELVLGVTRDIPAGARATGGCYVGCPLIKYTVPYDDCDTLYTHLAMD